MLPLASDVNVAVAVTTRETVSFRVSISCVCGVQHW